MARAKTDSHSIAALTDLSAEQVSRLRAQGIRDLRFFLALTQIHEAHVGLRRVLGVSERQLDLWATGVRAILGANVANMTPKPIGLGQLGCTISELQEDLDESGPRQLRRVRRQRTIHKGAPSEVDLIDGFGPIRDQGMRGTCVAHAFAAAREFVLDENLDLSEQFLYWDCKQRDGLPGPGTYMSTAVECLAEDGVCREESWPYNPELADDEGQGPPPPGAAEEAGDFIIHTHLCLDGSNVEDLKAFLAYGENGTGHPFTFAIPVYPSWGNAETSRTGFVPEEFDGEQPIGHHALICCGYFNDNEAPGGGYFVFRNSWGTLWAYESQKGGGYGFLSYSYMQRNARDCFALPASKAAVRAHSFRFARISPAIAGITIALAVFLLGNGWRGEASQAIPTAPVSSPASAHTSAPNAAVPRSASAAIAPGEQTCSYGDSQCLPIGDRVRQIWRRLMNALSVLKAS